MRIGVLGGSVAGLACAHYLIKAGHRPTVIEATGHHGSLTERIGHADLDLDRFHVPLHPGDTALCGLLGDLGALDRLVWRDTQTAMFAGGRLCGEDEWVRRAALPLADRARAVAAYLYATRMLHYGARLDSVSAAAWLRRTAGRRSFEQVCRPILRARFGDYFEEVAAYHVWTLLNRHRPGGRQVRGYYRGGPRALAARLRESIEECGAEVIMDTSVVGLEWDGARAVVDVGKAELSFDAVVSTLALPDLAKVARGRLVRELPFAEVPYRAVVTALVVARRPLGPFYATSILDENLPFHTVLQASEIVPCSVRGGRTLLYMIKHCAPQGSAYLLPREVVQQQAVDTLTRLAGFDSSAVESVYVSRTPRAEPIWPVGSLERRPPLRLGEARVYLCTKSHAYPRPTSWDTAVMLAREAAGKLRKELS